MRQAVVHEWLSARTGSELVFEQLAQALPDADLYALTVEPGVFEDDHGRPVTPTFLNGSPMRRNRALQLALMPMAWRRLARKRDYDLVVTSSHCFSRHFTDGMACTHLSYVHAPMRYAWSSHIDERGQKIPAFARRSLQRSDRRTVASVTSFAANSNAVRERIQEYYERDAVVIHPPVDVSYFSSVEPERGEYVVAASRWIPYKRLDLAIRAAARADVPIKVLGSGPEEERLRAIAREEHPHGVEFVVQPARDKLREVIAGSRAMIFPADEDFGIIAVEAQAAGVPVVGLARGGSLDTVVDGVTGVLAADQTVEAVADALVACLAADIGSTACRAHAERFSVDAFHDSIASWIASEA